eukprot:1153702-Pelagomonas_calceolata.AAC.3
MPSHGGASWVPHKCTCLRSGLLPTSPLCRASGIWIPPVRVAFPPVTVNLTRASMAITPACRDGSYLALRVAARICTSFEAIGTWQYLAPEYRTQGHSSVQTDTYALGLTLLQVCTGLGLIPAAGVHWLGPDPVAVRGGNRAEKNKSLHGPRPAAYTD